LVSTLSTLDDLEGQIAPLLQKRCIFGSLPQKGMKIDPYYQWQKCRPINVVSGNVHRVLKKVAPLNMSK